ncbi:uncharacterized protein LOC127750791 [Frankliniella occidentalis]|uniref:Uncharacterized protein LOC127750791 n=1 Tax=Frankliniella occidentalis TaxID=133901 RepID=A0A9C6XSA4_FRAOC|nr:uncharacterized protein LOC127750791 [Frankliniella occidentalis]
MSRVNTLTLFVPSGVPKCEELAIILTEELGLSLSEIDCVQYEHRSKYVHVKLHDDEKLDDILREPTRWIGDADNEFAVVCLLNGAKVTNIKIQHLPVEVEEDELCEALSEYGCMVGLDFEHYEDGPFKGLKTGARLGMMSICKPIPNFVQICGFEVFLTYPGQPKTCKICGGTTHLRAQCSERRSKLVVSDAHPEPCPASGDPPPLLPPADDAKPPAAQAADADATQQPRASTGDVTLPAADEPPKQQPVGEQKTEGGGGNSEEHQNAGKWQNFEEVLARRRKLSDSRKRQASGSPEMAVRRTSTRSKKEKNPAKKK